MLQWWNEKISNTSVKFWLVSIKWIWASIIFDHKLGTCSRLSEWRTISTFSQNKTAHKCVHAHTHTHTHKHAHKRGEVKNVTVGRTTFRENHYHNYIIHFYSRHLLIPKLFPSLITLSAKGEKWVQNGKCQQCHFINKNDIQPPK